MLYPEEISGRTVGNKQTVIPPALYSSGIIEYLEGLYPREDIEAVQKALRKYVVKLQERGGADK